MSEARKRITGHEVYHSKQFRDLCELIGVPWDARTVNITIQLTEEFVKVVHNYQGDIHKPPDLDATDPSPSQSDEPEIVDTTTLKNEKWRTKEPRRKHGDCTSDDC